MIEQISAWDENDRRSFGRRTAKGIGEISIEDSFGSFIFQLALDRNNKFFLEIGTWNGLGSTACFAQGLKARVDDFVFFSLEVNNEKSVYAENLYKHENRIHILNESILRTPPSRFNLLRNFPRLFFPHLLWHRQRREWLRVDRQKRERLRVDCENIKFCRCFLDRTNVPEQFDVVLLDGGEYTTYFEYQILRNRTKYLLLDDVRVEKCKRIRKELLNSGQWALITEDLALRNGWSAFMAK